MKICRKKRFASLLFISLMAALVALPAASTAAQLPVNLGTTTTYAVLAGSTITNTGTTIINGDAGGNIGLYPGTSFTGQSSMTISGAIHLADAAAGVAKNDLVIAYNDAAGRLPVTRIPTELGGTTLTSGVYDSADGTFQITGTLTLDAQGNPDAVFVFKTASTLITASSSNVSPINSARYCRIFWEVGSSVTLGTNSRFVGHIFAMASITANTGAFVQGQLMARDGAVTLDSNTITNGICGEVVAAVTPAAVSAATGAGTTGAGTAGTTGTGTAGTTAPGELADTGDLTSWKSMAIGLCLLVVGSGALLLRRDFKRTHPQK